MSDFRFIDNAVSSATHPLVGPLMTFANDYWWPLWCVIFFLGFLLTLAPWQLPTEHNSFQSIAHFIRRSIFYISFISIALLSFIYFLFDITFSKVIPNSNTFFLNWFLNSLNTFKWYVLFSAISGLFLRFYYFRFFHPWVSSTLRDFRNRQSDESESDIRHERLKYNPKSFNPEKFYDKDFKKIFLGIDSNNDAVYVPASTWLETNMMITGPTRYGKGIVIGCLMEQAIIRGDQLIYIDPKNDKFAAKIMLQTCAKSNRPFYYVSLSDEAVGYWSPFEGGKRRDAYNRLISIFGMMENSGDADFYKAMEKKVFNRLIKLGDPFDIESIYKKVKFHNENVQDDGDRLLKIEAQLENWRQVESLNPPKNYTGFSLEKAMLENAVVYFQGSLNDEVVKTATKSFILEVIQESARLDLQRKSHLTFMIDEVRFLVSKTLADALATIVGFRVNIVTACQSINDLKTPDDINLDGEATYRSISTNSQLKLVYGGADSDTAEWVAKLSGTIVKQVTSMEKVTVKSAGAEEWDLGRTIKPLEEALITENVALTLPPRVCVVFRPSELATVTFTAPVPVKDMAALDLWLIEKSDEEKISVSKSEQQRKQNELDKIQNLKSQSAEISSQIKNIEDTQLTVAAPQVDLANDPDDYNVDDTQLTFTAPQVDLANDPDDYNVDDTQLTFTAPQVDLPNDSDDYNVDDTQLTFTAPQVDLPNDSDDYNVDDTQLTFDAPQVESSDELNPILTNKNKNHIRSHDIYELSQKDDISDDELRYLFTKKSRQIALENILADQPELFAALLEKFKLLKVKKQNTPLYIIEDLAKQEMLTESEAQWICKTPNRQIELQSKNPELYLAVKARFPNLFPVYNIDDLVKKKKFTTGERNWIFKNNNVREVFEKAVDPAVFQRELAIFSSR